MIARGIAAFALAGAATLERLFQSPSLSGAAPRCRSCRRTGGSPPCCATAPTTATATTCGRWTPPPARRGCWSIPKLGSGAELSEEEKMRRERLRIAGTKGITAYQWAPDGRSILVPLDGDLYLAALDGSVRRLTETKETELDAQVSKTGRFLSFVRDQNLFVPTCQRRGAAADHRRRRHAQLGLGRVRRAGGDGPQHRPLVVAGRPLLAVARVDESPVKVVTRAAIGAEGTRLYEQRYPVAGSANALVDLYVMAPDGSPGEGRSRHRPRHLPRPGRLDARTARRSTSSARAATRRSSTCCASIPPPASRRCCSARPRRPGSTSTTI
jgi:dipeptidyl-peptidase-4